MLNKTCCVTGHRDIPPDKIACVTAELRHEISAAIADGYTHFISGFAEGTDLIFAAIVAELKIQFPITFEAAIPYRKRLNTPNPDFQKHITLCDFIKVHSEEYSPSCFMVRNWYMVEQSDRVIAVYDGRQGGGTATTLKYARMLNTEIRVINISLNGLTIYHQ